jgi:GxxExxY protein
MAGSTRGCVRDDRNECKPVSQKPYRKQEKRHGFMSDHEALFRKIMDAAFHVHLDIGPGLLESVYETLLADRLQMLGYYVETQKVIDIRVGDRAFRAAFRADLIVDRKLLVEVKSVENLSPVHLKQALTYIRLLDMPLGMLVNFGGSTFKGNVKRVMNDRAAPT